MEAVIRVPSGTGRVAVVGASERNLKLLREALDVEVLAREGRVTVTGSAQGVTAAKRVLEALIDAAEGNQPMGRQQVMDLITDEAMRAQETRGWTRNDGEHAGAWEDRLNVFVGGKPVRPKTENQRAYLQAIREYDLVFGLGPAGTGKTYLAVAAAVHLLRSGQCKRVILARPAVEAGERLGFLPGDLREKVNPYLRPLLDALNDMMDFSAARRFVDNDVIEVVPLAFMRGRTLNNSVVILDEAQNSTAGQMKMFLTRLGQGSKMIVTGDPTQTDLPPDTPSGLTDAAARLARTEGVAFVGFDETDVVRHDLVRRIIAAYEPPKKGPRRRAATSENAHSDRADGSIENGDGGAA